MRSMVEGLLKRGLSERNDITVLCQVGSDDRRLIGTSKPAPSTALSRGPPPPLRGGGRGEME
jgi:hypothetical protein